MRAERARKRQAEVPAYGRKHATTARRPTLSPARAQTGICAHEKESTDAGGRRATTSRRRCAASAHRLHGSVFATLITASETQGVGGARRGASRVVAGVEANSTLTTSRGRRGQATTQGQPMLSRRSRITPTGCMHVGRERPASKRRGPTHEGTAGKRARRRRHRDRRCRRQGERAPHTVGTHAPAGALPVLLKRTLSHRMMRVSECPLGNNPIFPLTEARPTRTRAARRKSALLRLRGHQAQAPGDRHDATRLATHSATADAGASRCTGAACSVCAAVPQEAQGSARRGRPFSLAPSTPSSPYRRRTARLGLHRRPSWKTTAQNWRIFRSCRDHGLGRLSLCYQAHYNPW